MIITCIIAHYLLPLTSQCYFRFIPPSIPSTISMLLYFTSCPSLRVDLIQLLFLNSNLPTFPKQIRSAVLSQAYKHVYVQFPHGLFLLLAIVAKACPLFALISAGIGNLLYLHSIAKNSFLFPCDSHVPIVRCQKILKHELVYIQILMGSPSFSRIVFEGKEFFSQI